MTGRRVKRAMRAVAVRIVVSFALLYGGLVKALRPGAFLEVVYGYGLLPEAAVWLVATTLPALEMILGATLLFVPPRRDPVPAAMACSLFTLFTVVQAILVWRGMAPPCGCFGADPAERVGPQSLIRTALLAAATAQFLIATRCSRPARLASIG